MEDSARGSGSARPYGDGGLGGERWQQLEGDRFWEPQRERGPEEMSGAQLLERLVLHRLIDPGSEFRGFDPSAWMCG